MFWKDNNRRKYNDNNDLKKFIKQVKSQFPFCGRNEKLYLENLSRELSDYLRDFPDAGFDDLTAQFGTPKDIAAAYFNSLDAKDLSRKIRLRKRLGYICFIVIIAAAAFSTKTAVTAYQDHLAILDLIGGYSLEQIIGE